MIATPHRHAEGPSSGRHRYCPRCGAELEPRDIEGRPLPACSNCDYIAFRDPKVVAVAVISDYDGAVWLIRRAIEPCVGEWALPGGYVDYDEHPSAAAARECREEIGCVVRLDSLLGVHHVAFADGGVVVIAYSGVIVGGSPHPGPEVMEVRHFPLTALPPLAFATHRAILAELASTANATVPE